MAQLNNDVCELTFQTQAFTYTNVAGNNVCNYKVTNSADCQKDKSCVSSTVPSDAVKNLCASADTFQCKTGETDFGLGRLWICTR